MSDKRLICYIPLHYGKSFLHYAIKSVEAHVEKIVVLYSDLPTFGRGTSDTCPDSEQELHDIAIAASNKVDWRVGYWGSEGEHRNYIYNMSEGFDGVLTIDSDEVFDPIDLPLAIEQGLNSDKRYIGFGGYINFWKSFNYSCYDGFTPIRLVNLHGTDATGCDVVPCKVYHFSTAQTMDIMRYKLKIHGHHDEIRPGWLEMFENWKPGDIVEKGLHLVSHDIWQATAYDKEQIPDFLKEHPYFNLEEIK